MSCPVEVLHLVKMGLETLSAAAFQGLGSLQVLVLDWETGLMLDDSLQEQSPQMPQYSKSPTYKQVLSRERVCKSNLFVSPTKLA